MTLRKAGMTDRPIFLANSRYHRLYISQSCSSFQVPNTLKGIKEILEKLSSLRDINLIVCEATGGYERLFVEHCLKTQLPVHRAHANKIRHFAKAAGYEAKTDPIDAKVIALFAQAFSLEHTTGPLSQDLLHLKDLSRRRQQLLSEKIREENRLEIPVGNALKKSIRKHLKWLEKEIKEIKEIENEIQNHIDIKEDVQQKIQLLSSMKGVGKETSLTLLTHLPEIGTLKNASLAALVGVAPFNRESGNLSKKDTSSAEEPR